VRIEREGERQVVDVDEFAFETRMRYFTASEILADCAQCPLFRFLGGWNFIELYATMPGQERVWFPEGNPERALMMRNSLHAYFRLNERLHASGDAAYLTFATVSTQYRFANGEWVERASVNPLMITRIARVSEQRHSHCDCCFSTFNHLALTTISSASRPIWRMLLRKC
jgi:hypothetical protein